MRFLLDPSLPIGCPNSCHHLAVVQVPAVKAFNLIIIPALSGSAAASVCWSKMLGLIEQGGWQYTLASPTI